MLRIWLVHDYFLTICPNDSPLRWATLASIPWIKSFAFTGRSMTDTLTEGTPWEAMAPDTLDLAEHARLGLNSLLGSLDPAADFDPYFLTFFMTQPPYMLHWSSMYSGVLPKYVEAIPLLRLASGSDQDRDLEQAMLEAIVRNTAHDGLIYDEKKPSRPWNCSVGYGVRSWHEDYANLAGNGRLTK